MLEDQDIKKISEVIDERLKSTERRIADRFERLEGAEGRIIEAVGEMIEENILPLIANLPDKAYLDEKLANLEGKIVARERKIDHKVNRLIEIQHTRKLISDENAQELKTIPVFPVAPTLG